MAKREQQSNDTTSPINSGEDAAVSLVPDRGRIVTIDMVRGFAIIWVVLYHLWADFKFPYHGTVPERFEAVPQRFADGQIIDGLTAIGDAFMRVGYLGVPLFMILSGLSLTLVALRRDMGPREMPRFWYTRIRRVMIPYWFGFALTMAFAVALAFVQWQRLGDFGYWHYLREGDINVDPGQLFAGAALIPRAFKPEWHYAPEGSLWFVFVLVQYYLLFPLLLALLRRIGPVIFLALTLGITLVSLHAVVAVEGNLIRHESLVLLLAPFRIFEFGLGMTAGWLMVKKPALLMEYSASWIDSVSFFVLGALCLIGACLIDPVTGTSLVALQTSGVAIGMTLMLFPLVIKTPGALEGLRLSRLLAWIGTMSYTVLIVNEPLRSITHHMRAEGADTAWMLMWVVLIQIPLTLLLARPLAVWLGLVERATSAPPPKGAVAPVDLAAEATT